MTKAIDFYFEFSSPYGYFASKQIAALAQKHGCALNWKPFLLGAAFKKEGTSSLISYPMKGPYSKRDIERCSGYYDIPFAWPPVFPIFTVHAARTVLSVQKSDPEKAVPLIHAVYDKAFVAGEDIGQMTVVLAAAQSVGLDPEAVSDAARSPEIKALLKKETEAALDKGVFGSPFVLIEGEAFWGVDRFDMIDAWLARGGW
jgi:2-hydroxychromene-2-carboxylate isomerase